MKMLFRFTILFVLLLSLSACGSPQVETDPIAIMESYEAAWNAKDLDKVMEHFTDDAVETNGAGTFTGKDEIRGIYAQVNDIFSMDRQNYQVSNDSVTYDCVLTGYTTGGCSASGMRLSSKTVKLKQTPFWGLLTLSLPYPKQLCLSSLPLPHH